MVDRARHFVYPRRISIRQQELPIPTMGLGVRLDERYPVPTAGTSFYTKIWAMIEDEVLKYCS